MKIFQIFKLPICEILSIETYLNNLPPVDNFKVKYTVAF